MFEKLKRIFRREKYIEPEAYEGGKRRKSLLERVRRSIIPDDITFSRSDDGILFLAQNFSYKGGSCRF